MQAQQLSNSELSADPELGRQFRESLEEAAGRNTLWRSRSRIGHTRATLSNDELGDNAATCKLCQAPLGKRHFNPRHRCRVCNASVCARCAPNRLELEGARGPQRACAECAQQAARLPQFCNQLVQSCATMKKLCDKLGVETSENANEAGNVGPETLDAAVQYLAVTLPLLEGASRSNSPRSGTGCEESTDQETKARQLMNPQLATELECPSDCSWTQCAARRVRPASTSPVQHSADVEATASAQHVSSDGTERWFCKPSVGTWLQHLPLPSLRDTGCTAAPATEKVCEADLELKHASGREVAANRQLLHILQQSSQRWFCQLSGGSCFRYLRWLSVRILGIGLCAVIIPQIHRCRRLR